MSTLSTAKKEEIGILGGRGLLGSDLVKFLANNHKVDSITRQNYEEKKGTYYKVLINANGNTRRFWANQNPQDDFIASTLSVYKSIFDFPCGLYIYISSPDVYKNHSDPMYAKEDAEIDLINLNPYGLNKYLSELIVKANKKKFIILRSSMILGTNLKKGPIYDIISGNILFITLMSQLQIITTRAISEIIEKLLENKVANETVNVGGKGSFDFEKIGKYFDRKIKISSHAETQVYEMNVKKVRVWYPNLKTSEEYLEEFISDYLV